MDAVTRMRKFLSALAAALALGAAAGCATIETRPVDTPDGGLRAAVAERLAMDPLTGQGLFQIDVDGDRVAIRGLVRSESERMRVLGLVRGTPGVNHVTDRLRLMP